MLTTIVACLVILVATCYVFLYKKEEKLVVLPKRVYTREEILSYRNLVDPKEENRPKLKIPKRYAKASQENLFTHKKNSKENSENIKYTFNQLNNSKNESTKYADFVKKSVENKNLSQASYFLNEMERLGLEVKPNLMDSYLKEFNSQRKPLGVLKGTTRKPLSALNPNAQDFNPTFKY